MSETSVLRRLLNHYHRLHYIRLVVNLTSVLVIYVSSKVWFVVWRAPPFYRVTNINKGICWHLKTLRNNGNLHLTCFRLMQVNKRFREIKLFNFSLCLRILLYIKKATNILLVKQIIFKYKCVFNSQIFLYYQQNLYK